MWVKASTFEKMMTGRAEAVGKASALEQRATADQITREWMAYRLTQLEHERAQLIFRYMGIKITTPVLEPDIVPSGAEAMSDIPSFNDVGDEQAKRDGLDWDNEGRVTQHGKVVS